MRHFLDVFDDGRSVAALGETLVALFSKETLLEHWSLERLRSPEARAGWVEPDLQPLPALEELTREDREWLQSLTARVPVNAKPANPAPRATPAAVAHVATPALERLAAAV